MGAKKKNTNLQQYSEAFIKPKDLNDQRKSEILKEKFDEFQSKMLEELGIQIGIRLQKFENETTFGHQAMLVPVKPAQAPAPGTQQTQPNNA